MVAITIPAPTIEAIDAHYEAHQDVRQPQRITARLLSGNCERQAWYAFRWAHAPKRFPGHFIRANLSRQDAMNELSQALSDIGIKVERVDKKTFQAIDVLAIDGHYRQKIAGIATGILEAPKAPHLLYLDQQPSKVVAQIVKHGIAVAKPDRIAPIQLGMHLLGLQRAFYMVRNKDTDELHSERIEYSMAHAMALLAKGERVQRADVPPYRVSDDPNWFECGYCPAKDICHGGGFALRNCRTCLHSSPVVEGAWHCDRHDRPLSIDDQHAGCPNHLYLPGLVPGKPDDADEEAETITYTLTSGAQWVDGASRATSSVGGAQ